MKNTCSLLITLFLLVITQPSIAEIYKYTDKDGNVQFTDKKPPQNARAETVKLKINTVKNPSISNNPLGTNNKIVMYSATWCGVCKKAKKYFNEKGIPFTEYDIEKSVKGRRDFKRLSGKGVPLILIGNKRMSGFNRSFFDKMFPG